MRSWRVWMWRRVVLLPFHTCRSIVSLAGLQDTKAACLAETVSQLCQLGQLTEAVEALGVLVQTDCGISKPLFFTVLKECVAKKNLALGRRVHAFTLKQGHQSDTILCNHILRMYASHARLEEATNVFTMVARPDAFTWSAMISAHVKHGRDKQAIQLYHRMRRSEVEPDAHVFVAALQACARGADLASGQQVHAHVLAEGLEPNLFVSSALVVMYAKCGSLEDARRVFDGLGQKDVVTWNALLAGYSHQGMGQEAFCLYDAMVEEGTVVPDSVTYLSLLQACASMGTQALEKGKHLDAQIRERGHHADVFVANSLVSMYAKCGSLNDAQRVFDRLGHKDIVTWNSLIAGYAQQGQGAEALRLYDAMQEAGTPVPTSVTFLCLLQACASVGTPALAKGKELHAQIIEKGLQGDVFAASSLVDMYAKCGSLEEAQRVFDGLGQKDVVAWSAIIAGYYKQGMVLEVLRLYNEMQGEGLTTPDAVTFVYLLQACASVGALHVGRQLHAQINDQGLQADLAVAGSLISMYGKTGGMSDAQKVFEALPERDTSAWNAIIAGYTCEGNSGAVFNLFRRMRKDGIQPDGITFLSVLTACSHSGLPEKGRAYFEAMSREYGISPTVEHYTCIVDLLGRVGRLDESLALVKSMPVHPDAAAWHTVLGACQKWSNVEVGCQAFNEAVKLQNKDAAAYVLMANIYTEAGMSDQADEMHSRRKRISAWKLPGQSVWTDLDGLVHSFWVEDKNASDKIQIGSELRNTCRNL